MTTDYVGIAIACCFRCKVAGVPFVRINYGSAEKPDLGPEVYCIACGQARREALNDLIASGKVKASERQAP